MPETATHLNQVNVVMVPVSDQDRAIDFFVERLGFEKRADIPYGPGNAERWIEVAPPGASTSLALTLERDGWETGRNTGVSFTTSDIDAAHADLRAADVDIDEAVMRMDGPPPPMVWFRDGDGNTFLIVEA